MAETPDGDPRWAAFSSPFFAIGLVFTVLGISLGGTNGGFLSFLVLGVMFLIVAFTNGGKDGEGDDDD